MKKDLLRYALIFVCVVAFGLFIYPTLYKYDKLDQRYPVKINRITGESEILTKSGWERSGSYDSASDKMLAYKDEILTQIELNRQSIKDEVISEIKDDIIAGVQSELDAVKNEITAYKAHELDPDSYFGKGDTMEKVNKIMGTPSSTFVNDFDKSETWYYSTAYVVFDGNGKVKEWSNPGGKVLRVK